MKFQSILTKSLAAAALTATGLVALNSQNTNDAQAATIVQNDTNVVTINIGFSLNNFTNSFKFFILKFVEFIITS